MMNLWKIILAFLLISLVLRAGSQTYKNVFFHPENGWDNAGSMETVTHKLIVQ